ncbi:MULTISPECIES: hypothetical protein [Bacillaceae]|nr:hypothetical protein [Virgibacillus sp. 7505]
MIYRKSVTGTAPSSLPLGGVFSKQIYFGRLYVKAARTLKEWKITWL